MLNIITGRVQRPQKVVLYGVEGIGIVRLAPLDVIRHDAFRYLYDKPVTRNP